MENEYSVDDELEKVLHDEREEPCNIPLQYLRDITANFSDDRVLGKGGFGVVYEGVLRNGKVRIAVKNIHSTLQCPEKQFKNEIDNLMRARHKNIVRFVGYCYETKQTYTEFNETKVFAETAQRILCFEYMRNGSLDKYISEESRLDWHHQYKIIKGICSGLHYLHKECQQNRFLIHMDLKPANVLLDYNLVPKIADFGMARLFDGTKTHTIATSSIGTIGYMAPECLLKRQISPMADVYSLGIIIMEMITGQKHGPSGIPEFSGDFVEPVLENWRKRLEAATGHKPTEADYEQIQKCLDIGISCIQFDPKKRPTVTEIVKMLNNLGSVHCHVKDERRRRTNKAVQSYRQLLYGEDSIIRNDQAYTDLLIHDRAFDDPCEEPGHIKIQLLQLITDYFSDELKIANGGRSTVYKGVLRNRTIVVRRLLNKQNTTEKMFKLEVKYMAMVRHPNIVRLLGYCSDKREQPIDIAGNITMAQIRERLICVEYMSNGSLENYISDELRGLEWHKRYQIIKGICEGLHHLHNENNIIHTDLRPGCILLDDNMVPKISNFCQSILGGEAQTMSEERLLAIGYRAPEYQFHGKISVKSDIYSLGVTILELITGGKKKPCTTRVLRRWNHRWNKSAKGSPVASQQVTKCLDLALRCMQKDPSERPGTWDIICELKEIDMVNLGMLGIEPLELHLPFELNKAISGSIKLINDTDDYFAFKITSTGLRQYHINPSEGIVRPRFDYCVTITLQARETAPGPSCTDEFTVESTRVHARCTVMDITGDLFIEGSGNVVDDVNLVVVLDTFPLPASEW